MLRVVLADFVGTGRPRSGEPFVHAVPGFFKYLADERGLRPRRSTPTGTISPSSRPSLLGSTRRCRSCPRRC
jgi:hypothetical protein